MIERDHHYHRHYCYSISGAFLNAICTVLFIVLLIKLWYIVIPFMLVSGIVLGTIRARRQRPAAPMRPATDVPQAHYSNRR
jgi:hypothetical protein